MIVHSKSQGSISFNPTLPSQNASFLWKKLWWPRHGSL